MSELYETGPPNWGSLVLILQPSCLALICTAVGTVAIAALRALKHDIDIYQNGVLHSEAAITLTHHQALAIPLISSVALLSLFYFFKSIQLFILAMLTVASIVSIIFVAHPLLHATATAYPVLRRRVRFCSTWQLPLGELILGGGAFGAVLSWFFTGSMLLNNFLGISLCIAFISFIRLPSLKVTTLLLSALFVYDIFWVFFSERLFGQNVMLEAATRQADNPAVTVATALNLPSSGMAQHLDLPVKLVFPENLWHWRNAEPSLMLGLGDMALPGMLIALLFAEDFAKWQQHHILLGGDSSSNVTTSSGSVLSRINGVKAWEYWRKSYVLSSLAGYCLGLFLALAIGTVFQAAQPALLYLVPCTLLPAVVIASRRRELRALWEGWENENRSERKEAVV